MAAICWARSASTTLRRMSSGMVSASSTAWVIRPGSAGSVAAICWARSASTTLRCQSSGMVSASSTARSTNSAASTGSLAATCWAIAASASRRCSSGTPVSSTAWATRPASAGSVAAICWARSASTTLRRLSSGMVSAGLHRPVDQLGRQHRVAGGHLLGDGRERPPASPNADYSAAFHRFVRDGTGQLHRPGNQLGGQGGVAGGHVLGDGRQRLAALPVVGDGTGQLHCPACDVADGADGRSRRQYGRNSGPASGRFAAWIRAAIGLPSTALVVSAAIGTCPMTARTWAASSTALK